MSPVHSVPWKKWKSSLKSTHHATKMKKIIATACNGLSNQIHNQKINFQVQMLSLENSIKI